MPTSRERRTLIIVSLALFMVVLDNLVVSVALAPIHRDLGSSVQSLEWTVNAYTLCYAVFLLSARRSATASAAGACSSLGLVDLHAASALAGLAPDTGTADRGTGDPGRRRRHRHAADPDAARGDLRRRAARPRARGLVGDQRHGRRARPARRRRRDRRARLALDLRHQRPDRPLLIPVAARTLRESHGPNGGSTFPGSR